MTWCPLGTPSCPLSTGSPQSTTPSAHWASHLRRAGSATEPQPPPPAPSSSLSPLLRLPQTCGHLTRSGRGGQGQRLVTRGGGAGGVRVSLEELRWKHKSSVGVSNSALKSGERGFCLPRRVRQRVGGVDPGRGVSPGWGALSPSPGARPLWPAGLAAGSWLWQPG